MRYERHSSWQTAQVVGLLLLVFLAGAVAGAIGMRYRTLRIVRAATPVFPKTNKEISLPHLRDELHLDQEQTKQVGAILDDVTKYTHTLQDQMDDVRADGRTRISRVLKPEQRQKFDQVLSEMQKQSR